MGYPPNNFGDMSTIRFQFVGHWANMAMRPWPLRSWHLWLMHVVVFHPCTKFEVCRPCHSEDMAHDVCQRYWAWWSWPLTLKLVCESHLRWRTFLPNLGTLDLWVLELFTMYATAKRIWHTMCVCINGPGDPDLCHFDRKTGMRVTSKVGNRPSKFGHARPLGSGIICYVRDGQTDRRTDVQTLIAPFPMDRAS